MGRTRRPQPFSAEKKFEAFMRWWWTTSREDCRAWLRGSAQSIPRGVYEAYQRVGGEVRREADQWGGRV